MDTITTSIGRVTISGPGLGASPTGPTIEGIWSPIEGQLKTAVGQMNGHSPYSIKKNIPNLHHWVDNQLLSTYTFHFKCFHYILRRDFRALFLSHSVYPPMYILVQPCIKILFVPHVGQGGVDKICWDPQLGSISWMPNDCNHIDIFILIASLCIYLLDFDCFNCVTVIDLLKLCLC